MFSNPLWWDLCNRLVLPMLLLHHIILTSFVKGDDVSLSNEQQKPITISEHRLIGFAVHGPIKLSLVHPPPLPACSEPGETLRADSLSRPGRCCGPAAAAAWRRSRGTCGRTRAQTSPGTPGIHPPLDPSASWRRDRQPDRDRDRHLRLLPEIKWDLFCG